MAILQERAIRYTRGSTIYLHLEQLSSLEEQLALWILGDETRCSTFVEACCQPYNDSGLGDFLDQGDTRVLDPELRRLLVVLGDALDQVDSSQPDDLIIASPEMKIVRGIAGRALAVFRERYGSQERTAGPYHEGY